MIEHAGLVKVKFIRQGRREARFRADIEIGPELTCKVRIRHIERTGHGGGSGHPEHCPPKPPAERRPHKSRLGNLRTLAIPPMKYSCRVAVGGWRSNLH